MPKETNVRRKRETGGERIRRRPDEIRELLQRVAAARTSGLTLTNALQQVSVPYNTYHKWTKKYPHPVSVAPAPPATPGRRGKSVDEIRRVLSDIAAARKAGMGLIKTLREIGLPMSTYRYWLKKQGGKTRAAVAAKGPSARGAKRVSVLSLVEEMTDNRRKRQELAGLEKQIIDLDARFEQLRKKLDDLSGR